MNTQELNSLTKYYMKIIEENNLMFQDYQLKCWQQAYRDMEKKYDENMEDGNKS